MLLLMLNRLMIRALDVLLIFTDITLIYVNKLLYFFVDISVVCLLVELLICQCFDVVGWTEI